MRAGSIGSVPDGMATAVLAGAIYGLQRRLTHRLRGHGALAAGNAAGSQVEALAAGSPVLHITTQIDRPWLDRDRAAIHDVPRQADMLRAISKADFRVWEGRTAVGLVEAAARAALTAPCGPVSLEIPIDVQREKAPRPSQVGIGAIAPQAPEPRRLNALVDLVLGHTVE